MTDILLLLIGATLANNFVLTQQPAVYPLNSAAGKLRSVIVLAAITSLVLMLSSVGNYWVYNFLLLPFGLAFLRTVIYLLVIATLASLSGVVISKTAPEFSRLSGLFTLLITTNAAALGLALVNDNNSSSFPATVVYGLGTAAGFSLLLILFSVLRERLMFVDVPQPFQGPAIALITAGLVSLAFMGFAGLV